MNALQAVFPGDADAQAWLLNALQTIDELLHATNGVGPATLQFSLLEALYARGFTSRAQIQALSAAEFEYALTGTVAYPYAAAIQAAAGGSTAESRAGPARPVHADQSGWIAHQLHSALALVAARAGEVPAGFARHRHRRDLRASRRPPAPRSAR